MDEKNKSLTLSIVNVEQFMHAIYKAINFLIVNQLDAFYWQESKIDYDDQLSDFDWL